MGSTETTLSRQLHPPPNLKLEEERELLVRYQRDGDTAAREELIRRLLPLARRLARRYGGSREPLEDLVQVASLALVKAIDSHDVERGTALSSYAVPTILGELRRYFRDSGWSVHVPRSVQERSLEVKSALARLSTDLGRSPTTAELALEIGATPEETLEAMDASKAYEAMSLDTARRGESDGEGGDTYLETLGSEDSSFDEVDERSTVAATLVRLPDCDRRLLHMRFVEELTQAEIGERMGISQMHVSRLLRRALDRASVIATRDPELMSAA